MKNTKLECDVIKDEQTELKTEQYLSNIKSKYILKNIIIITINQKLKENILMV